MNIFKAHKIWESKQKDSDFKHIKVFSSGAFRMKSKDLFDNKEKVEKYVSTIRKSLKDREMAKSSISHQGLMESSKKQ